jgi:hypothetical protein
MQEEYWSTHLQIIFFWSHLLPWLGRTLKSAQVFMMVLLGHNGTSSFVVDIPPTMWLYNIVVYEQARKHEGWKHHWNVRLVHTVYDCFQLLHFSFEISQCAVDGSCSSTYSGQLSVVQQWKHVVNLLWDITMMWTSTWIYNSGCGELDRGGWVETQTPPQAPQTINIQDPCFVSLQENVQQEAMKLETRECGSFLCEKNHNLL